MEKKAKERKEYQEAVVNLEKALHEFECGIKIMSNCYDFQNYTVKELKEITVIVLKLAKLCKKVAEMSKKHKQEMFVDEFAFLNGEEE